jgi:hypothetical protein
MLVCTSARVCVFIIWATILYDPVLLNIYNIQKFTLMKMIMSVYHKVCFCSTKSVLQQKEI